MKISEQKRSELYDAFHEPVVRLRIESMRPGAKPITEADLAKLEREIWPRIAQVLNLPKPW